jgi:hypothetical protein
VDYSSVDYSSVDYSSVDDSAVQNGLTADHPPDVAVKQTADKLAVEELELPPDGDLITAAVAAAVSPGGRQEDDTLTLPAKRLIKATTTAVDGQVGAASRKVSTDVCLSTVSVQCCLGTVHLLGWFDCCLLAKKANKLLTPLVDEKPVQQDNS